DDVGVNMLIQVETDTDSSRAGFGWIVVRDVGQAGGVRVTNGGRGGWPGCVRCAREFCRFGRGSENARAHQAFGVGGPESRMHPVLFVKGVEYFLSKGCVLYGAGESRSRVRSCGRGGTRDLSGLYIHNSSSLFQWSNLLGVRIFLVLNRR